MQSPFGSGLRDAFVALSVEQSWKTPLAEIPRQAAAGREAALHRRIRTMPERWRHPEDDAAAPLRLEPLPPTAALLDEQGLLARLCQSFRPDAQLSVTSAGRDVFAVAAQAGRENNVATAIRRRMAALASRRLTGTHPGILAIFVEDALAPAGLSPI